MKEKTDSISGYWQKLEIESAHYGEFNDYGRNDDNTKIEGGFRLGYMTLDEYYTECILKELDSYELTKYDILRWIRD